MSKAPLYTPKPKPKAGTETPQQALSSPPLDEEQGDEEGGGEEAAGPPETCALSPERAGLGGVGKTVCSLTAEPSRPWGQGSGVVAPVAQPRGCLQKVLKTVAAVLPESTVKQALHYHAGGGEATAQEIVLLREENIRILGDVQVLPRKVDIRLPGKGNSNSHGARPVY